jgi:replicative DNA helicase
MSLSVDLVFRLLEEKKFGEYKDKVRPEILDSSGLKLYEFIDSFFKKYQTLPTISLVAEEFGLQRNPKESQASIDVPIEYIIDELKKKYDIDQFVDLSVRLEKQVSQGLVEEAKDELKNFIKEMNDRDVASSSRIEIFSLADKIVEKYQDAKDGKFGIPTPWKWLDSWTLGWYPKDVSFIAARPSVGKTWISIIIALAAWRNGARVLFASAEMSQEDIARRAFTIYSKMNYSQIRKGSLPTYYEPKFFSAIEDFKKESGFEIVDPRVSSKMSSIESCIAQSSPDFVVIDACYAVKSSYKSRDRLDNVAMVAQEMKDIAMTYNTSILGTTQLNRDSTKKKTHGTEDLAMSDVLGFVGSNVLMLSQSEEEAKEKHLRIHPLKIREMENARSSMLIYWDIANHKFDEVSSSEISGESKAKPSYMDIDPPADDEIF